MENDLVRRALASAIQRDGITNSLSESFKILEGSNTTFGWAGNSDFDLELMSCNELGYTDLGDSLTEVFAITWVEF